MRTPGPVAGSKTNCLIDAAFVFPVLVEAMTGGPVVCSAYHPYRVAQSAKTTVASWMRESGGNGPAVCTDVVGPKLIEHVYIGRKSPPALTTWSGEANTGVGVAGRTSR